MSAATVMQDVAAGAAAAISAAAITSQGNALKVYDHEPRDLDTLPAVTIDGPTSFRRVAPEESESQLGATDWHLGYTLRVYIADDDPSTATGEIRTVVGQVVAAIDADETLGGAAALGARVAAGQQVYTDDPERRQMVVMECQLEAWALVA